ncbi:MAG: hypothetical protein AAF289_18525 [Cyanobacteria bacterium P01_A01_bin.135]
MANGPIDISLGPKVINDPASYPPIDIVWPAYIPAAIALWHSL